MGEIGESQKKRRLYRMRQPTMRKMQTEQIWGMREQKEREGRGEKNMG